MAPAGGGIGTSGKTRRRTVQNKRKEAQMRGGCPADDDGIVLKATAAWRDVV